MKTYKICKANDFNRNLFSMKPISLQRQTFLDGVEPPPLTSITKQRDADEKIPFDQYFIEHEKTEVASGRSGSVTFQSYIHRYPIHAYHLMSKNIFFLQGRKKAIQDLFRQSDTSLNFAPIFIDLNRFHERVEPIHMVWFRFHNGQFSSTSFYGENIKSIINQKDLLDQGRITTLSFTVSINARPCPMLLSHDGTLVIQAPMEDIAEELSLLYFVYTRYIEFFLSDRESVRLNTSWKDELTEDIEPRLISSGLLEA